MPVIKFKKRKGHTPSSGVPHEEDRPSKKRGEWVKVYWFHTYRSLA